MANRRNFIFEVDKYRKHLQLARGLGTNESLSSSQRKAKHKLDMLEPFYQSALEENFTAHYWLDVLNQPVSPEQPNYLRSQLLAERRISTPLLILSVLLIILSFPLSLPILIISSLISHGTWKFWKTEGEVFIDKLKQTVECESDLATSQSSSNNIMRSIMEGRNNAGQNESESSSEMGLIRSTGIETRSEESSSKESDFWKGITERQLSFLSWLDFTLDRLQKKFHEDTDEEPIKYYANNLFGYFGSSREKHLKGCAEITKHLNELLELSGCYFHIASELPVITEDYKACYIFSNDELYYVRPSGKLEAVKLNNHTKFLKDLDSLRKENSNSTKLRLSHERVSRLITSNGGHAHPRPNSFADLEEKLKERMKSIENISESGLASRRAKCHMNCEITSIIVELNTLKRPTKKTTLTLLFPRATSQPVYVDDLGKHPKVLNITIPSKKISAKISASYFDDFCLTQKINHKELTAGKTPSFTANGTAIFQADQFRSTLHLQPDAISLLIDEIEKNADYSIREFNENDRRMTLV